MAQGVRPPEPAIAHPLRGGTDLTHRVAIVLGGAPMAAPAGWPALTARAAAEPRLDAWAGFMLGSPANVRCRVSYPDPVAGDPGHLATVTVTLDSCRYGHSTCWLWPLPRATDGRHPSSTGEWCLPDAATTSPRDPRALTIPERPDGTAQACAQYPRFWSWHGRSIRYSAECGLLPPNIWCLRAMQRHRWEPDYDIAEIETRAQVAETALTNALNPLTAAVTAVPSGTTPTAAQAAALRGALRGVAGFGPTSG